MGSQERRTALKAAAAYYGFSSAETSLPKTVDASVNTVLAGPDETPYLKAVAKAIRRAWPENVGNVSRTARLGEEDLVFYLNQVRADQGMDPVAAGDKAVREAMEHLVGDGVCLVELTQGKTSKLLLVNTDMSS